MNEIKNEEHLLEIKRAEQSLCETHNLKTSSKFLSSEFLSSEFLSSEFLSEMSAW